VGRDSLVGIGTHSGLHGPGIESLSGLTQAPGGGGQGVALITHPYLSPRLKQEYSYTSTLSLRLNGGL